MTSVNTKNPGVCWQPPDLFPRHARWHAHTHKQTHTGVAATGERMKMKEQEERDGGKEKKREEKSPCGRGRFSSSLNQLIPPAPPPRCSLHLSLPVTHHTNLSSASFFLLLPLCLFEQPLFCFSHHLPILFSSCPPTSSFFAPPISPPPGFHCFVL